MKTKNLFVFAVSVAAVGAAVYFFLKNMKVNDMLDNVADEGYEVAQDILYPQSGYRRRGGGFLPA